MPRVDPERSFEASARHLFRHINDVQALRLNPLLRSYFVIGAEEDRTTLERVHADILALADALCTESASKGLPLRGCRRQDIVTALCQGKTAGETAAALQISRSHYYRERNAICSQIALALKQATTVRYPRSVVRGDSLRLLFGRAESLRDAGSSRQAVRLLEEAYPSVTEELAKSTVGLELAKELVFLGQRDRALELLARSSILPINAGERVAGEWLHDMWTLNKARLQSQLGRDADAGIALETLAKRRIGERRSDDVSFDAVFLSGEWYRNSGRYEEARKMLVHLQALERRHAFTVAKRQIGILLLAGYCAESTTDELGLAEQSLRDALDLSISSGTVIGALLAMSGLIHHEAADGRDEAVYIMAHEALRLAAGVDFDGFLGYVVAEIADALSQTRYWRAAAPLVFDVEKVTAPGTDRHALLKRTQATILMRSGRRNPAREAMDAAYAIATRLGNRRIEGLILRDRALMLSGSKTGGQRADLMREAVQLIERFGSASDLAATYEAAARILADRRSLRLAKQARATSSRHGTVSHGQGAGTPIRIEPLRMPSPSSS